AVVVHEEDGFGDSSLARSYRLTVRKDRNCRWTVNKRRIISLKKGSPKTTAPAQQLLQKIARGAVAGEEEGATVRQPARRVCDSSRRALLGREGIVGRRSYPITIKQRGGARMPQEKRGQAVKEGRRYLHKKEINREKGQRINRGRGQWCHRDNIGRWTYLRQVGTRATIGRGKERASSIAS
ncbi:hypothetical protein BHE74_00039245, partial [Ensete ventricosum]